jgi:hypothetical protein
VSVVIGGQEYVPVEESLLIKHKCGHEVYWQFMPGVDGERFGKEASRAACPVDGGETGIVQFPAEWPCHILIAGVGLAHCHEAWDRCVEVEEAYRLGLATPEGEPRARWTREAQRMRREVMKAAGREWARGRGLPYQFPAPGPEDDSRR